MSLHLVAQAVPYTAEPKPAGTHHVVVIDCSGSMSGDLPSIRTQLKEKLPSMLQEEDLVSIIYFSGRGQFGHVTFAIPIRKVSELAEVHKAIDAKLRPIGLTGFKEPLDLAALAIGRVRQSHPHLVPSLFFMSDGYDNQWQQRDILDSTQQVAELGVAAATVVEYGYYANRALLSRMTEVLGGVQIFSENFVQYAPTFEQAMRQEIGGSRVEVILRETPARDGLVFALHEGQILTFDGASGVVRVPPEVDTVYYFGDSAPGSVSLDALYAAIALYATRGQSDVVWELLKETGDVRLIDLYAQAFGKQKISDFSSEATRAAFVSSARMVDGYDPARVPPEDAFTVLHLLRELRRDGNKFVPDHPAFVYNRIGKSRVQLGEGFTDTEAEKFQERLQKAMEKQDFALVQQVQADLNALMERRRVKPRFHAAQNDGIPISNLTPNASRANISALVRMEGAVSFEYVPNEISVPNPFESFVWRNFSVVRDGIVNFDTMPVRLSKETHRNLLRVGLNLGEWSEDVIYLIDLRSLPVVNRRMVRNVSLRDLVEQEYILKGLKAGEKVLKDAFNSNFPPRTSEGMAQRFGDANANWLRSVGITDNGFAPQVQTVEAKDTYIGYELKIGLKGYSSLPKISEVREQMAKGKVRPAAALMVPWIQRVDNFTTTMTTSQGKFREWLDQEMRDLKSSIEDLSYTLAYTKFAILVGQTWFPGFDYGEASMTISVDGVDVEGSVQILEKEYEI